MWEPKYLSRSGTFDVKELKGNRRCCVSVLITFPAASFSSSSVLPNTLCQVVSQREDMHAEPGLCVAACLVWR